VQVRVLQEPELQEQVLVRLQVLQKQVRVPEQAQVLRVQELPQPEQVLRVRALPQRVQVLQVQELPAARVQKHLFRNRRRISDCLQVLFHN
jgi:hypothetical protein